VNIRTTHRHIVPSPGWLQFCKNHVMDIESGQWSPKRFMGPSYRRRPGSRSEHGSFAVCDLLPPIQLQYIHRQCHPLSNTAYLLLLLLCCCCCCAAAAAAAVSQAWSARCWALPGCVQAGLHVTQAAPQDHRPRQGERHTAAHGSLLPLRPLCFTEDFILAHRPCGTWDLSSPASPAFPDLLLLCLP
jgi:hypothetical protein